VTSTCTSAANKLTTNIWKTREWKRGDFAALEGELHEWLAALIAGRYEEEIRLTHDGDAGKGRGVLKLSTGPRSGNVSVSVDGNSKTVAMLGNEVKDVSFALSPAHRIVALTVRGRPPARRRRRRQFGADDPRSLCPATKLVTSPPCLIS
jgi:hypothetical protein